MKGNRLKVGIIGLGIGEKHIESYLSNPCCEVAMICDFSAGTCNKVIKKYPHMAVTQSAKEVLENSEIRVVSIASYDSYHFEQVMAALKSGKHVMVEKPLCLDIEEAAEIRKFLRKNPDLKIASNVVLRTCPRFIKIKKSIQNGEMGNVFYIEGDYLWGRIHKLLDGWRKDMKFYSIVYGAAIHMIDLVLWMTDKRPVEVMAYGNNIATVDSELQFNSFSAILMKFEDGSIAKITANGGCIHPHFHRLSVFGTKKTVTHDWESSKWIESCNVDDEPGDIKEDYPAKDERYKLIKSFIDSIDDCDKSSIVSNDDVFDTMSVCFAIEKSMNESNTVKINYI